MKYPVVFIGGGGHAKVLLDVVRLLKWDVLAVIDPHLKNSNIPFDDIPVLGRDEDVHQFNPENIRLVNGVGSSGKLEVRIDVYTRFKARGYSFATVIHPSAIIASNVTVGEGAQLMAGVVVQPGCRINGNAIVNTRSSVDHDCHIGKHVHLAPGVVMSGSAVVGDGTHVGTGTTVIQGVSIGRNCLLGAGSVVVCDIPDNVKAFGVPAKVIKS